MVDTFIPAHRQVLGLIVITLSRTSPFFKVLTLIVTTRTPTHLVKTVQVHILSLLQHEQSSPPHYLQFPGKMQLSCPSFLCNKLFQKNRFWAFQRFQPPPLILRKNEGIMSLPCSAIKQDRSRGILHEFYTPP